MKFITDLLINKYNNIFIKIRIILSSIIFNFRHLPCKQAIRLPILLYKPRFLGNPGKIVIEAPVKFGMIKLGFNSVSIYPFSGIALQIKGTIIFKGSAYIGNNSTIAVGEGGLLVIGDKFSASTTLKLVCYNSIYIDAGTLIGWNVMITDSDFHSIKNESTGEKLQGTAPISIGKNVWIANGCKLYKNSQIPPGCVIGADTVVHKPIDCPPRSLIISKSNFIIKPGFYRDAKDDAISYPHRQF